MTTQDIRNAKAAGDSNWEILAMTIRAGYEFPDAVWKVSQTLRMDEEEREQMERDYDECC